MSEAWKCWMESEFEESDDAPIIEAGDARHAAALFVDQREGENGVREVGFGGDPVTVVVHRCSDGPVPPTLFEVHGRLECEYWAEEKHGS